MIDAPPRPKPPTMPAALRWGKLDFPFADIKLRAVTEWERGFRAHSVAKEPWTVEWIGRMNPETCVLWDVGANVGPYALIGAARGLTVFAFEPGYANYAALCDNVLANSELPGQVLPIPFALSDKTGIVSFQYHDLEAGAASHTFGGGVDAKAIARLDTFTITADDLLYQWKIKPPTHIKLDVDGAELQVLRGMRGLFDARLVHEIMIEMSNNDNEMLALRRYLAGARFAEVERWTERAGQPIPGIHYELWRVT